MTIRGDHPTDTDRGASAPAPGHIDDWIEQAIDYLDGRATPQQKADIEAHLAVCPDCARRMAEQQSVASLMQSTELDDAPVDIKAAVMQEVLRPEATIPVDPAETPQALPHLPARRRSLRSLLDNRLRRWLPVTAVVIIALVASMATYGALKQNMDSSPVEQSADMRSDLKASQNEDSFATAPEPRPVDKTPASQPPQASVDEEDGGTIPSTTTAAAAPTIVAAEIKEKTAMREALENAEDTVLFAFEALQDPGPATTAPDGTLESNAPGDDTGRLLAAAVAAGVADDIETIIDLDCLPSDLCSDGPTFAALVSRDQLASLWRLLVEIEAIHGISLSLLADPDPEQRLESPLMRIGRDRLPVVHEQPHAVTDSGLHFFTTSSLPQVNSIPTTGTSVTSGGEHILVIITIRQM